jgi:EAL domain-containing protein (putative c-di-GMP-specific phosphodiesterase class I)
MSALRSAPPAYVALACGPAIVAVFAVVMDDSADSTVYLIGGSCASLLMIVGASRLSLDRRRTGHRITATDQALASLRPVYQPIVDLWTGEVVAREALSRFAGQEPYLVFDRAALDGTANRLEAMAIRAALADWDGVGLLALNASPNALVSPQLRAELPADLVGIVIEITEKDLVGNTAEMMLAIDELRARGALIAIDDFGVGFSNSQRVVAIRPDIVKLDMSIIRGIEADPTRQAVVAGAVLFGDQTNSQVVAEGIETPDERDCLVRLGIRFGQGFLLGAPEPLLASH